ncbi:helix-turn-helix transcriptional regulator [Mammaliicoccus sciuri]|uniref:helix-turn-helix transcriptional regulator n=1 Tax=Mammaliicoccus sciuri TaxID=1296 RepID=UPI0021CF99EC|nr:HTH domain-containing protein [Mammaliicoccus sciuri]UXV32183.1 HTH domain-containing protein [Mammaliicoccus sciuri]
MNKAQRLLTIYTRLLNNQGVNKMNLADELEVDESTIQRDIDDIRNYLFDNEEHQQRMEVTYQHKSNEYRLVRKESVLDSSTFSLLITHLQGHSTVITQDIYELLKQIIYKFYNHDGKYLLEQLKKFTVINDVPTSTVSKLQVAIKYQNKISFLYEGERITGIPVNITSNHSQYMLWLKKRTLKFSIRDIKDLQIIGTEHLPNEKVVLKMTKDVWHILRHQYKVDTIETFSDDQITVTFDMNYPEVMNVCILYSPHIMLISPSYMYQPLVNFILAINAVYMNQQIQINNESKEIDNEDKEQRGIK